MAIEVRPARDGEAEAVARLQVALFREDAGTHDPSTDLTWPTEHGLADITELLTREDAVVLVATTGDAVGGFLAGYATPSSPTRLTRSHAVLRSLYVAPDVRREGVASALVEGFVDWARSRSCEEVVVDHYERNHGAARLYARHGFVATSVSRTLRIDPG